MENNFFKILLTKISEGNASDADLLLYKQWYEQQLLEELNQEELDAVKSGVSEEIFMRLQAIINTEELVYTGGEPHKVKPLWKKWLASAAAVSIIVGFAVYYWHSQKPLQIIENEYNQVNFDTTQGVILKLANGEQIDLTSISSDSINHYTDKKVVKNSTEIKFNFSSKTNQTISNGAQQEIYNTLYTPAGKTFQIVLADGTKVWLNAKSMLRFPINFVGVERRVQLIGEGYFEVTNNSSKPFIVDSKGQELKVLGTKFNIDAYNDGTVVKSTLFEGKVLINATNSNQSLALAPGDQSLVSEKKLQKQKVLLKNVLGWKDGIFVFYNEKLGNICNSLSRWYNVEFDTSNNSKIINQVFSGTVVKFDTIDEVLAVLSETGTFKYRREGRRIIFMK